MRRIGFALERPPSSRKRVRRSRPYPLYTGFQSQLTSLRTNYLSIKEKSVKPLYIPSPLSLQPFSIRFRQMGQVNFILALSLLGCLEALWGNNEDERVCREVVDALKGERWEEALDRLDRAVADFAGGASEWEKLTFDALPKLKEAVVRSFCLHLKEECGLDEQGAFDHHFKLGNDGEEEGLPSLRLALMIAQVTGDRRNKWCAAHNIGYYFSYYHDMRAKSLPYYEHALRCSPIFGQWYKLIRQVQWHRARNRYEVRHEHQTQVLQRV